MYEFASHRSHWSALVERLMISLGVQAHLDADRHLVGETSIHVCSFDHRFSVKQITLRSVATGAVHIEIVNKMLRIRRQRGETDKRCQDDRPIYACHKHGMNDPAPRRPTLGASPVHQCVLATPSHVWPIVDKDLIIGPSGPRGNVSIGDTGYNGRILSAPALPMSGAVSEGRDIVLCREIHWLNIISEINARFSSGRRRRRWFPELQHGIADDNLRIYLEATESVVRQK